MSVCPPNPPLPIATTRVFNLLYFNTTAYLIFDSIMLRRRTGDWRRVYGHDFEWTQHHLTAEQMRPMMFQYDELGSVALEVLDRISPPSLSSWSTTRAPPSGETNPHRDLYALLKDNASSDETLGRLWEQVNTVPEWVDWDQIERGQQVFYRYGGPAIVAV